MKDLDRALDDCADHLLVAVRPSPDQLGLVGVGPRQLAAGIGDPSPEVLFGMPSGRADLQEEPLPVVFVGYELAIEIARVPVEEHSADVECDGIDELWLKGVLG